MKHGVIVLHVQLSPGIGHQSLCLAVRWAVILILDLWSGRWGTPGPLLTSCCRNCPKFAPLVSGWNENRRIKSWISVTSGLYFKSHRMLTNLSEFSWVMSVLYAHDASEYWYISLVASSSNLWRNSLALFSRSDWAETTQDTASNATKTLGIISAASAPSTCTH